jgi:hypothetical protein
VVGDSHMRRHFQTSVLKGIGNKLVWVNKIDELSCYCVGE